MSARTPWAARLTPLTIAIAILGGCAAPAPQVSTTPVTSKTRFSGGTLAELEQREITVESGTIKPQTAEAALNNYQTALSLMQDPESRQDTLRRMAELTLESSQARDGNDTGTAISTPGVSEEALYQRATQGMAKDPALPARSARVNYAQAVQLYEQLLKNTPPGPRLADAYYELAKAYDLNGQREDSVAILRKLVYEYPGSPYNTEARFRIAEHEFSTGRYVAAADDYALVFKAEDSGAFRDQALYKQAWSLYRASDYDAAQPLFFRVVEEWQPKTKVADKVQAGNAQRLLDDTFNIISLGFVQQEGAKSVDAYFRKVGPKDYMSDVYMNLGQTYLGKRLYRNAADTYEYFVSKHPFDRRAPEFSSAIIKTFMDGGFPSEVPPAKEKFVKRYNLSSEYWAKADASTRQDILPLLQSHILDLARHQHALAQQSKKPEDYLKAASWYRQHLALNPPQAEALTINRLLAESLFAAQDFDGAITEFEKTAYQYPDNPKASESAYFALLAFLEQEKDLARLTPETQKSWWNRRVASTHKYAATFPADKNTPLVLQGLTNDQIANKDLAGAMKTAGLILQLTPPAPTAVQKEAWMVMADGEFDLNRPEAAEFAYNRVLGYPDLTAQQRKQYGDRLTASIYKQAEKLRDAKDVDGAVAAYKRAARVTTDPVFKAGAEFDAATMYLTAERHAEAIPLLVAFRTNFPDSRLNDTIPEKLAVSYEKTGQLDKAAAEYEGISASNLKSNPELAREALWTSAEMFEKSGRNDESLRIYRKYVSTFPKPVDVNMEAQFRLFTAYTRQNNAAERLSVLQEMARTYDRAGSENTPRTRYLGAMAMFSLGQPVYEEFASIALKQPLKLSLGRKRLAMHKALATYGKVAAIGVAEFTTASNYQIAETYRKLAADLMTSERPKGLSELELEQYGILLEEQALPFEDKALELYIANAGLAKQNIYDNYVRQSFDALSRLSPGRYNKHEQSEINVDVIY